MQKHQCARRKNSGVPASGRAGEASRAAYLAGVARHRPSPGRRLPAPRGLAQAQDAALEVQPLAPAHVLVCQGGLRHLRQRQGAVKRLHIFMNSSMCCCCLYIDYPLKRQGNPPDYI